MARQTQGSVTKAPATPPSRKDDIQNHRANREDAPQTEPFSQGPLQVLRSGESNRSGRRDNAYRFQIWSCLSVLR